MQVDVAHPPALPAGWRREPAPDQVGARAPGPAAGMVAPGPFGVAAAWQALGAHGRVRTPPGVVSTPLRAPAAWDAAAARRVARELLRTHSFKALSPLPASCGS